MPLPKTANGFDTAAYLAWEETQAGRNEYIAGEVFAMVGVRQSHNVATLNLATVLRRELKLDLAELLDDTLDPSPETVGDTLLKDNQ